MKAQTIEAPTNTKSVIYVGVDPGFSNPCLAIIGKDESDAIFLQPDTKTIKWHNDYDRAYQIGLVMARFVHGLYPNADVVLGIEGPSFGSQSSSMEQLAGARQAIFDAFYVICHLVDWKRIAPTTAKKALTGNGRADKESMVAMAVAKANALGKEKIWKFIKKRATGLEEKILDQRTVAMADALGIAMAVRRMQ